MIRRRVLGSLLLLGCLSFVSGQPVSPSAVAAASMCEPNCIEVCGPHVPYCDEPCIKGGCTQTTCGGWGGVCCGNNVCESWAGEGSWCSDCQ